MDDNYPSEQDETNAQWNIRRDRERRQKEERERSK